MSLSRHDSEQRPGPAPGGEGRGSLREVSLRVPVGARGRAGLRVPGSEPAPGCDPPPDVGPRPAQPQQLVPGAREAPGCGLQPESRVKVQGRECRGRSTVRRPRGAGQGQGQGQGARLPGCAAAVGAAESGPHARGGRPRGDQSAGREAWRGLRDGARRARTPLSPGAESRLPGWGLGLPLPKGAGPPGAARAERTPGSPRERLGRGA